jgi:MFS family permease
MRKTIQLVYFLRFFGTGVIIPVLSLMLLSRGATIATISLLVGFYSVTVIAAEFPSGVFADVFGRRNAFLLSCVFSFVSYGILLLSRSIPLLLCGMLLHGLSRAFASGSIEALMIDQATTEHVPLERVTARLSILESAGYAGGALTGGLLADVGARFSGNLGANIIVAALLIVLTLLFVHESPRERPQHAGKTHLELFRTQIKESARFAKQRGIVRILLVLCLLMGFVLSVIEIYWQPALAPYQSTYWIFGAVSSGAFAFVILGSWLAEKLLRRYQNAGLGLLLLLKLPLGIGLVAFSMTASEFSIIGVYLALYLLIGSGSVVENTYLNRLAPAESRASILSLFSLVLQIGGVVAALVGYLVSANADFQKVWLLAGVVLLIFIIVTAFLKKRAVMPAVAVSPEPDAAGQDA